MNQGLRRGLMFVALAGSGVGLLWMASDDAVGPVGPIVGRQRGQDEGALGLLDPELGTETQITLQDITFERTRSVEVAPGLFEVRSVSRVRLRNGRPQPDGSLLVDEPVITFLDELTGAERGSLRASRGRFEAAGSVAGGSSLDVTRLSAEAFSLEGDVDGQFPLGDGSLATLACDRLRVDGERASAPGRVDWTRDALTFSGHEMTWDGTTGQLEFARDARLELPAADTAPAVELSAAGGLLWHLPLEQTGTGWGQLRGPVEGTSSDGASLSCDDLQLFADASGLQLDGDAEVRLLDDAGGRTTLRAASLTLANGDAGLALAEAGGGVVVELEPGDGVAPTLLRVDGLIADDDELISTSPVRLERGNLLLTGSGLRWREADQRIELPRDASLTLGPGGDPRYAGARLDSPDGLVIVLPAPGSGESDPRGELRGPVTGELPDGTRLAGRSMVWDGPAGIARLEQDVVVVRPDAAGSARAEADLLQLAVDPDGVSGALSLRGAVHVVASQADAEPLELTAERLDAESGELRIVGSFEARQAGQRLLGRDLVAVQATRSVSLAGPWRLLGAEDPETGGALRLDAQGALDWTLAEGSDDPLAGKGRIVGPLELHTLDGWVVHARQLAADGAVPFVELGGGVLAEGPAGESLDGVELTVLGPEGSRRLELPGLVNFAMSGLRGSGRDLHVDEAGGRIVLEHDIALEQLPAPAPDEAPTLGAALTLDAQGPLEWTVPPGATDAWREGRGRVGGEVLVRHAAGHRLLSEELLVDGPAHTVELVGASNVTSPTAEGEARLAADDGFLATFADDGALLSLHARGGVDGLTGDVLDGHALGGDELLVDRVARTITLLGSARLERRRAGRVTALTTGPDGRLQAVTDVLDQLVWVDAGGGVQLQADDVRGRSDSLTWNVAEDHVIFDGGVDFVAMGFGMGAPSVEFWPEQMRWFIPRGVIELGEAER